MTLTSASKVWNRAAMEDGGANPKLGDLALTHALALHGLAMNGGIHHALKVLSAERVEAAASGFGYFGLPEVGRLLWRLRTDPALREWTEWSEVEADRLYASIIPTDQYIVERFEGKYLQQPQDFAPLEADSGAV